MERHSQIPDDHTGLVAFHSQSVDRAIANDHASRPVASFRPWDPPSAIGLPVTTAVVVCRTCMELCVHHHAIVCSFVANVRRRYVALRPDPSLNSVCVTPRESVPVHSRTACPIANHSALCAAEWNIHYRTLQVIPSSQRAALHPVKQFLSNRIPPCTARAQSNDVAIAFESLPIFRYPVLRECIP